MKTLIASIICMIGLGGCCGGRVTVRQLDKIAQPPAAPGYRCVIPVAPTFPDNDAALTVSPDLVKQIELRRRGKEAREKYQHDVLEAVRGCNEVQK